mgnify:CR=1 FL=1
MGWMSQVAAEAPVHMCARPELADRRPDVLFVDAGRVRASGRMPMPGAEPRARAGDAAAVLAGVARRVEAHPAAEQLDLELDWSQVWRETGLRTGADVEDAARHRPAELDKPLLGIPLSR